MKYILGGVALLAATPVVRVLAGAYRRHAAGSQPGATAVAVLGAAQYDGRPSRVLQARIDHAAEIALEDPSLKVVTLGSKLPGDRFTEADVAASALEDVGVEKVRATPIGHSTWQSLNALETDERWVIVTTSMHALRTEALARQLGLDARVSGAGGVYFPRWSWWRLLVHEAGGLIVTDVADALGQGPADRLETLFRRAQLLIKPSDRIRVDQLENQ